MEGVGEGWPNRRGGGGLAWEAGWGWNKSQSAVRGSAAPATITWGLMTGREGILLLGHSYNAGVSLHTVLGISSPSPTLDHLLLGSHIPLFLGWLPHFSRTFLSEALPTQGEWKANLGGICILKMSSEPLLDCCLGINFTLQITFLQNLEDIAALLLIFSVAAEKPTLN